jgi:hypothetical protein
MGILEQPARQLRRLDDSAGWTTARYGEIIGPYEAKRLYRSEGETMIELNEEQRQELSDPEPVVIDPLTRETYVLISRKVYDRLKVLLEDDARLMYPLLADLDPEDWEDASAYESKP